MTNSKVKAQIRALQDEIGSDPAYARPTYTWCREQLKQENFARSDWPGFVRACKVVAKRAEGRSPREQG